jgi:peptide deformylase
MIYPIVVYGSPILRKVAKEIISEEYPNIKTLVSDMFDTMYKSDGMGLAAPQIGKSIRIFVVDATALADEDPTLSEFKKTFINPKIELLGEETIVMNEGCLSIPKIREDVERKNRLRITYMDEDWNQHEEVYDGLKARVIQHEYDHLDGILFVDLINPLRRKLIKSKLNDISKLKVDNLPYKIKVIK